jgi:aspartyl-tRNA(Asn)/glutamyl-tRNA(Gln) amidotransferase subunit B
MSAGRPVGHDSWEAVIGLEIHVQLRTRSKLFCACSAGFGAPPNTQVCPVCLGFPGALPAPNRGALELALRLGLAVGGAIRAHSRWARKQYFYPDLPKGYQITQYAEPLCSGGRVAFRLDGERRDVGLARIHLEEDAGKSIHADSAGGPSRIDLNRCGVPLAEIVTEPSLRSPREAGAVLRAARQLVRYLEVSDGNMEEGSLRCDANVSIRRAGDPAPGVRTEIKNLNSIRFLERALEYEIRRQSERRADGKAVAAETLLWDPEGGRTARMRGKEEEHDYRYFDEPDLPPLVLEPSHLEAIRAALPELPEVRRARLAAEYGLEGALAEEICAARQLADYFEEVARVAPDARAAAHWIRGAVAAALRERRLAWSEVPISSVQLGRMLLRLSEGTLNAPLGKMVLREMIETGDDPDEIIARRGWEPARDEAGLRGWIEDAIRGHPELAARCRAGKVGLVQFFVGEVMRRSQGRADPATAARWIRERLRGAEPPEDP